MKSSVKLARYFQLFLAIVCLSVLAGTIVLIQTNANHTLLLVLLTFVMIGMTKLFLSFVDNFLDDKYWEVMNKVFLEKEPDVISEEKKDE